MNSSRNCFNNSFENLLLEFFMQIVGIPSTVSSGNLKTFFHHSLWYYTSKFARNSSCDCFRKLFKNSLGRDSNIVDVIKWGLLSCMAGPHYSKFCRTSQQLFPGFFPLSVLFLQFLLQFVQIFIWTIPLQLF